MVDKLVDPTTFLIISFFLQVLQELTEVKVSDQIVDSALLIANRTFMKPVDSLHNARLAESMTTLCNVRVIICLEANDALGELTDDLLD